jgi:hypothetical protein
MNETRRSPEIDPSQALTELYSILGRLQAEGAMDEEGPIIQNYITRVERGQLSPVEALKKVQNKLQARGDYH